MVAHIICNIILLLQFWTGELENQQARRPRYLASMFIADLEISSKFIEWSRPISQLLVLVVAFDFHPCSPGLKHFSFTIGARSAIAVVILHLLSLREILIIKSFENHLPLRLLDHSKILTPH